MPLSLDDIAEARDHALHRHRLWKAEIKMVDRVAADDWTVVWPDGEAEHSEPLVENLYTQALEDKMASAGSLLPSLFVAAARGTRKDRAERNASQRRRVGLSYWDRSRLRRDIKKWYRDWFHCGGIWTMPWTAWKDHDGMPLPPAARFPYMVLLDPRTVFPIGHTSQGDLAQVVLMRQRRVADMLSEWGTNHEAIRSVLKSRSARAPDDQSRFLEEIWYFDERQWSVAVADSMLPSWAQGKEWLPDTPPTQFGSLVSDWLVAPEQHGLFGCPVTEVARTTHDNRYRGALVDIIPQLKVANNFMARLLDDLNANIYAPVVLDNIENPEDYGIGAVMVGTGTGAARIERDRPPVNFEARQTIQDILDAARKQAFEPEQRAGVAGASIVSGKGTMALMGSFNTELAWAQTDVEEALTRSTAMCANFDEVWAPGTKGIMGWDNQGRAFVENYDARTVFKGDYRFSVSYGERTGLDEQSHMTRLGLVRQLGGISLRTFMEKSGIAEDPLQEEREIAIEKLTALFLDGLLPQMIQGGDLAALQRFVDRIDGDDATVRGAVLDTIRELTAAPAGQPGEAAAPGGGNGRADVMKMMRSLAFGGVPGRAEGLPLPGRDLQQVLPPTARRQVAETAPGGTALPA